MSESCMHAVALGEPCPDCPVVLCRCGHDEREHGVYGPCLALIGAHKRLCGCSRYEGPDENSARTR